MLPEAERELLLNNLPGAAYRCAVAPPWLMEFVSPGVQLLCSYTPSDFIKGDVAWGDLIHPEDATPVSREVSAAISSGRKFSLTYRIVDPDLGTRWMLERGEAVYDDHGNANALVGFITDITEQKSSEERARNAESRYALAARATGDIIWDWDLDKGTVERSVEGSALGYDDREFEGDRQWWEDRVHPDDVERVAKGVEQLLNRGGDRWSDEYRLRRADGSYAYILDRGFLVPDEPGRSRRMVGAMQDLSDRKAAEEKIEQLQSKLVHMSQVSAMGTMASTLAHELNQPLLACSNYLTGAKRLLSMPGDQKEQIEAGVREAEQQIQRAGQIIRSMRRLIEKQRPNREVVSLRAIVGRVIKLVGVSRICLEAAVRTRIASHADNVFADPTQIEQVLINLLRNACEATAVEERPDVLISVQPAGDYAEVRLRDRGKGLSEEALQWLFKAFPVSTSGGLGVGLSISRTIVEAHGGKIWAENNPNGGATFTFTVPLAHRHFKKERREGSG